jgi:hypothetical protein
MFVFGIETLAKLSLIESVFLVEQRSNVSESIFLVKNLKYGEI